MQYGPFNTRRFDYQSTQVTVDSTLATSGTLYSVIIPATALKTGMSIIQRAYQRVSRTASGPSFQYRILGNGTALYDSGTVAAISTVTNAYWRKFLELLVNQTGTAGEIIANGDGIDSGTGNTFRNISLNNGGGTSVIQANAAPFTLDISNGLTLVHSITFASALASNNAINTFAVTDFIGN